MSFSNFKKKFQDKKISKKEYIEGSLGFHDLLFEYAEIIKSTDIDKITITEEDVCFLLSGDNIEIVSPRNESRVAPIEILNFDAYEKEEVTLIDKLTYDCKSILDVGANIGWFSLHFATQNLNRMVYAFEPVPETFKYLKSNITRNELDGQITCLNYALSDTNGSFKIYVVEANGTNASLKNVSNAENAKEISCLTITLDEWCQNFSIMPDFIKCDVEGAELLVFRGAEVVLAKNKPIIYTELLRKWSKGFEYHPNDLLRLLKSLDYICIGINGSSINILSKIDDETIETNFLFLHNVEHKEKIKMILPDWNK